MLLGTQVLTNSAGCYSGTLSQSRHLVGGTEVDETIAEQGMGLLGQRTMTQYITLGCGLKVTMVKEVTGIRAERSMPNRGTACAKAQRQGAGSIRETPSLGARKGEHTVGEVVSEVLRPFYLCHMPSWMACMPSSGTWPPILRVNVSLSPLGSCRRNCT